MSNTTNNFDKLITINQNIQRRTEELNNIEQKIREEEAFNRGQSWPNETRLANLRAQESGIRNDLNSLQSERANTARMIHSRRSLFPIEDVVPPSPIPTVVANPTEATRNTSQITPAISDDAATRRIFTPPRSDPRAPIEEERNDPVKDRSAFSMPITPRPNPLAKFSSYSYAISIYMMPVEIYNQMRKTPVKDVSGAHLILQSGGEVKNPMNNQAESSQNSDEFRSMVSASHRNSYFDVDFFIDDIVIKNLSPQATGRPHTVTEMSFKVYEPYGISFIDRLKKAAEEISDIYGISQNYAQTAFLMVIRFYGYDKDGNLILGNRPDLSSSVSVDEKFIFFKISNIKFRLTNQGLTEYDVVCYPLEQGELLSSDSSTIKFNIELSGETVGDILLGEAQFLQSETGTERGENENTSSITRTVTRGFVAAMNKYYLDEAGGNSTLANEIVIEIAPGFSIEDAKVKKPGITSRGATTMSPPSYVAADQLLSSRNGVNTNERNYSVTSGMPVIQFLELLIRTSTYITDQQLYEFTENTNPPQSGIPSDTREVVFKTGPDEFMWFKISFNVEIKGYNPILNSFVYKKIYTISPYQAINNHPAFPQTKYRGSHKRYDYWFTGQNKELLNFEQEYNYAFYASITLADAKLMELTQGFNPRELEYRYAIETKPTESGQGGYGDTTTAAAAAASMLYNLADNVKANLTILGDPDWLGEVDFFNTSAGYQPWLPGSGVNYMASQPVFELNFNTATDYDLETGLMDVGKPNYNRNKNTKYAGDARFGFLYQPVAIQSNFKNGAFTQNIEALIANFADIGSTPPSNNNGNSINADQDTIDFDAASRQMDAQARENDSIIEETARQREIAEARERRYPFNAGRDQDVSRQETFRAYVSGEPTQIRQEWDTAFQQRVEERRQLIATPEFQIQRAADEIVRADSEVKRAERNLVDPSVDGGRSDWELSESQQRLRSALNTYEQQALRLTTNRDDE